MALLTLDALAHTQLLMRSLLGPDPAGGARFYGIGNELKSGLAAMVLAAVAAALHPSVRGRRGAAAFAAAGGVLAAVEGAARIGAGVGSVLLVGAGFGLAAALMIAGAGARRRTLIALAGAPAALALLAAIDLATAHGAGHFSASLLHAHSWEDLRDLVVRRYTTAWGELDSPGMWLAVAGDSARRARVPAPRAAGCPAMIRRSGRRSQAGSRPAWWAPSARTPARCCSSSQPRRSLASSGTCTRAHPPPPPGASRRRRRASSRRGRPPPCWSRTPWRQAEASSEGSTPSARRSSAKLMPSTRTRFSRACAPARIDTLRRPTPARLAIRRQSASLARPSTGGALTRTTSRPSRSPTISSRRARGCSRTAISQASTAGTGGAEVSLR